MTRILLSLVPVAVAFTALGQTPGARPAAPANIVTESGKVARFVVGPGDRPQGFLLRNGTFVILPPGLSQRMPATIPTNASISVAGSEFTYEGGRTIQAQRVLVAGVAYEDILPAAPVPPAPPAPPRAPRRTADPGGAATLALPPCPSASAAPVPPAPAVPPANPAPPMPPAAPPPPGQ